MTHPITDKEKRMVNSIIDIINDYPESLKGGIYKRFLKRNKDIKLTPKEFEIIYEVAKTRWITCKGKFE